MAPRRQIKVTPKDPSNRRGSHNVGFGSGRPEVNSGGSTPTVFEKIISGFTDLLHSVGDINLGLDYREDITEGIDQSDRMTSEDINRDVQDLTSPVNRNPNPNLGNGSSGSSGSSPGTYIPSGFDPSIQNLIDLQNGTGSIFGSLTGSNLSKSDLLQMQFQMDMQKQAQSYNADMYEKYNTIQAQADQYRQAGFNPMLAVTGSDTKQAPSSSGGSGSISPFGTQGVQSILQILGTFLNFKNVSASIDKMRAESQKVRSETRGIDIGNHIKEKFGFDDAEADLESKRASIKHTLALTDLDEAKAALTRSEQEVADATAEQIRISNEWIGERQSAEIGVLVANSNLTKSQTKQLNWQNAKVLTFSEANKLGINVSRFGVNKGSSEAQSIIVMYDPDTNEVTTWRFGPQSIIPFNPKTGNDTPGQIDWYDLNNTD